jgi:hypothetical protein
MKYVYLLWDYQEHGPENIVAADSPSALLRVAADVCGQCKEALDDLKRLLECSPEWLSETPVTDSYPRSHRLGAPGWGGPHLQVLRLWGADADE